MTLISASSSTSSRDFTIVSLRRQVERLEEEVYSLRQRLKLYHPEPDVNTALRETFHITKRQATIAHLLLHRNLVTRVLIRDVVYDGNDSSLSRNVVDVFIAKIRKAFAPHGVQIENIHGSGWRIAPEGQTKLLSILKGPTP